MALELSPISALSYQIVRSYFEVVDLDKPGTAAGNLSFQFNAGELRQEDTSDRLEAMLEMSALPDGEDSSGFKLDIAVRGMFAIPKRSADEDEAIDDAELFMRVNAFTLLYAFIRSHVQMLTSISPTGQVCLPCLDVDSIVDLLSKTPPKGADA